MMKNSFAFVAILGSLAHAAEEHHMEMENQIISSIKSTVGDSGKFHSYKAHLAKPAMHSDIADGKKSHSLTALEHIRHTVLFHLSHIC